MSNKDLSRFGTQAILASLATGALIVGTATACGTPATAETTSAAIVPTSSTTSDSTRFSDQLRQSRECLPNAPAIPLTINPLVIAVGDVTVRMSIVHT